MQAENRVGLGVELVLIHQSIGRAIHISKLYSDIFRQTGFPEGRIRPGFADYVRSLVSVLHSHHLAEDEVAFPALREKLPIAPYDRLLAEHRQFRPLLEEVRLGIRRAVEGPSSQEPLAGLDRSLRELERIWKPHIETEQAHFSAENMDGVMAPEEQADLASRLGRHVQEHSGPDYLVVPFTLFNLPPESRAVLSETLPPAVTQQLLPGAWKEKWQPMSPFLLV